jgi:hypothetical protein
MQETITSDVTSTPTYHRDALGTDRASARTHASVTVKEAVEQYLAKNSFSRAEYAAASVPVKLGPITIQLPNGASRRKAIAQHDVHHVLTGYATNLAGEAEIGAWELRGGCTSAFLWFINLAAVMAGLVIAPRRVFRAFRAAKGAHTLYALDVPADEAEALTVADLRARAGIPPEGYGNH